MNRPAESSRRMAIAIQWQLKFRVRKQASFDKCLAGAAPLLGPGSVAGGGQPY